ncbi:MAG: glycosyltransferase [Bacilli bacterium]|nr:glycosyltransferase [Bacilli bacterium]
MNKISVIIPALNEEKHIKEVIDVVKKCNLIHEIIVVDNNSTDKTNEIAKEAGAKTLFCKNIGKGHAMETGINNATGDIIVFIDGDICNYEDNFIAKIVKPIINKNIDFIKTAFAREGGRITELVAKPLLELLFPELKKFDQPLSGIIAGKKEVFEKITFEKDYGVDIGILIDVYQANATIEQVNIGKIENCCKDWKDLVGMAKAVSRTIINRYHNEKKHN